MHQTNNLLFVILSLLLAATLNVSGRRPELLDDRLFDAADETAVRDASILEATQAAQLSQRAAHIRHQESIGQIQQSYHLPLGTIADSRPYNPAHYNFYVFLFQDPHARLVRLAELHDEGYSLYARPISTRNHPHFLLLARIYHQGGAVVPMGMLQIRPGVTEGYRVDFFTFLDQAAVQQGATCSTLQDLYGPLHILEP